MIRFALALLLLSGAGFACAAEAGGAVWLDRDGNGRHDDGEPGVAGVMLSNGRDIATTDARGRYRLPLRAGDTLFVIKPAGYRLPTGGDGLPVFWRHHFPEGSPSLRHGGIAATTAVRADFALLPGEAAEGPLEVVLFGDPQPKSLAEVGYYARDIVEPLRGDPRARLGLTLGDVVGDDLSLYPAMNAATAWLGLPWLHAAGNHDLDFDAADDAGSLHTFRRHFGPDSFAWEEPQASFVVLDDVVYRPGERPDYIGGLREDQFDFLASYLPTLPKDRLLVLAAHIPFFDPDPARETFRRADRERLFALLAPFPKVLLLTAHGHVQRHHHHGEKDGWHGASPLHEYNMGAACGGFWGGVKDADGIPDASMADGTPNGYARLTVAPDGEYALRWSAARAPGEHAVALHAPAVLRRGAYPAVGVYANVFMGMADDRVEFRVDDGEWRPMQRVLRADPRILAENLRDDAADALRAYDRLPEAVPSTHLWRAALPTDLATGAHRIQVRAFDRWRGELRAETSYRLVDAAP